MRCAWPAARATASSTSSSRRTSSGSWSGSSPRASSSGRHERVQIVDLRRHRLDELRALRGQHLLRVAQDLDVGAHAGERRAQLVRASAINRRWATARRPGRGRLGERVEHGVEAAGQAGQLVAAARVDAPGEVPRGGDVLARLGEPLDRSERGPGREAPSRAARAIPTSSAAAPTSRMRDSTEVDLVEGDVRSGPPRRRAAAPSGCARGCPRPRRRSA